MKSGGMQYKTCPLCGQSKEWRQREESNGARGVGSRQIVQALKSPGRDLILP